MTSPAAATPDAPRQTRFSALTDTQRTNTPFTRSEGSKGLPGVELPPFGLLTPSDLLLLEEMAQGRKQAHGDPGLLARQIESSALTRAIAVALLANEGAG